MSAKRKPSAIVSGAGWLGGFVYLLEKALLARGWTHERIHALVTEADPADQPIDRIADMLVGKVVGPIVQVAWELVFKFVIGACRFVSYIHPDINAANFPYAAGDLDIKEIVIVKIEKTMNTAQVLALLEEQGLRPARLMELLLWWLTHPAEQGNCLVVALGQLFRGGAPGVGGAGGSRKLSLARVDGDWNQFYGFAAVRKSA